MRCRSQLNRQACFNPANQNNRLSRAADGNAMKVASIAIVNNTGTTTLGPRILVQESFLTIVKI
jgi:hypothetical protein